MGRNRGCSPVMRALLSIIYAVGAAPSPRPRHRSRTDPLPPAPVASQVLHHRPPERRGRHEHPAQPRARAQGETNPPPREYRRYISHRHRQTPPCGRPCQPQPRPGVGTAASTLPAAGRGRHEGRYALRGGCGGHRRDPRAPSGPQGEPRAPSASPTPPGWGAAGTLGPFPEAPAPRHPGRGSLWQRPSPETALPGTGVAGGPTVAPRGRPDRCPRPGRTPL